MSEERGRRVRGEREERGRREGEKENVRGEREERPGSLSSARGGAEGVVGGEGRMGWGKWGIPGRRAGKGKSGARRGSRADGGRGRWTRRARRQEGVGRETEGWTKIARGTDQGLMLDKRDPEADVVTV
eukprot:764151-Hanusia_phi.AAC.2